MGKIVSIFSTKGGTGKSLIAVNVATLLAQRRQRVLVIDSDAQGNSTTTLCGRGDHHPGLAPLLMKLVGVHETIRPTATAPGVDIIPGGPDLSDAAANLATQLVGRDLRLRQSGIDQLGYDWVLIDCPPERSTLTVNALAASDGLIVPVDGSLYGVDGLTGAYTLASQIAQYIPNPSKPGCPALVGIVLNKLAKNKTHNQLESQIRSVHGGLLLGVIPNAIAADSATFAGVPLVLHSPKSTVSAELEKITANLLKMGAPNVAA
jgi:chromosome partitioning protein